MLNRIFIKWISLITLTLLGGCSSIATKTFGDWGDPYSGTRCWFEITIGTQIVTYDVSPWLMPVTAVGNIADLPLSFVLDTLLVAPDLMITKTEKGFCSSGSGHLF